MRRRAVGASFTRLPLNLLADLSASAPCALVERGPVCGRLYGSAASSREEVVGNGSRALRAFLTRPTTWAGSCSAALNGACAASWPTIKSTFAFAPGFMKRVLYGAVASVVGFALVLASP
jgi:hypothetical protein